MDIKKRTISSDENKQITFDHFESISKAVKVNQKSVCVILDAIFNHHK